MILKHNEYETLEYVAADDEFSVIGRILIQDEKFVSAEVECILGDVDELAQARAFLDVVEKKIVEATQ